MGYAKKKLVSTASKLTSIAVSHLPKFPPNESLYKPQTESSRPSHFSPTTWASLQPPPPSALEAFAHRIGLSSVLKSTEMIQQACTHASFIPLHNAHLPPDPSLKSNAQLANVGNSLMGLFATEYLHVAYPYLPTRVFKGAVSATVGSTSCANVAQEIGVTSLLRWNRTTNTPTSPAILRTEALASVPRAITALIYQERSLLAARKFVHSFFLSREFDLRGMLKFYDPKKALAEMVKKFNRERPKSRLLKETGRFSNSPVYVVGIYVGPEKLGEGFGSSLRMAEYRAAEDALLRVYLTRTPDNVLQLPTSTFSSRKDLFEEAAEGTYEAPELPAAEIMYASGERTRTIAASH